MPLSPAPSYHTLPPDHANDAAEAPQNPPENNTSILTSRYEIVNISTAPSIIQSAIDRRIVVKPADTPQDPAYPSWSGEFKNPSIEHLETSVEIGSISINRSGGLDITYVQQNLAAEIHEVTFKELEQTKKRLGLSFRVDDGSRQDAGGGSGSRSHFYWEIDPTEPSSSAPYSSSSSHVQGWNGTVEAERSPEDLKSHQAAAEGEVRGQGKKGKDPTTRPTLRAMRLVDVASGTLCAKYVCTMSNPNIMKTAVWGQLTLYRSALSQVSQSGFDLDAALVGLVALVESCVRIQQESAKGAPPDWKIVVGVLLCAVM